MTLFCRRRSHVILKCAKILLGSATEGEIVFTPSTRVQKNPLELLQRLRRAFLPELSAMKHVWTMVCVNGAFLTPSLSLSLKGRPWRRLLVPRKSEPVDGEASSSPSSPLSYSQVFGSPKPQGYVPDGMSAEEYQNLRQKEAAQAASKNYGAWGPRFRQTDRPDGDWLLLPQLWTLGVPDNAARQSAVDTSTKTHPITRWLPAILVSWVTVNLVWAIVQLSQAGRLTARQSVGKALQLLLPRGNELTLKLFSSALVGKLMATLALAVPLQRRLNVEAQLGRYRPLLFLVVSSVRALVGLTAYALILAGIHHIFL